MNEYKSMSLKNLWRRVIGGLAALLLCAAPWAGAQAGQNCETKPLTAAVLERAMTLAERTRAALDASGAEVVVLARAGQDLSRYGLRYSHLGFAYRQPDGEGGQVWRVMHKLNQCGTAESAIYRQGLGNFFLDDLWRYEAAWVVPTPEVQRKLMAVLKDEPKAIALHHKPYSIVSYAWGQKYQQSNQWAIETLAVAMEPSVYSRERAQAWLKFKGYQPTVLRLGALERLGGRIGSANVAFDDHPNEKRFNDRIETVSVESVFFWLQRAQLAGEMELLRQ
ncbi:MAG: DUF2145 domain-containing protein [Hylemonella sp.]|nr:DUF2145 domain-containing protein [Hylemonella sp.]